MASDQETQENIVAELRRQSNEEHAFATKLRHVDCDDVDYALASCYDEDAKYLSQVADRLEAARKREQGLLRSCARWISTHDIYGNMAQELLAECKKVLGDDGKFLMPKEDMV